jgi:predicted metal-dependent HD superfamily phosphohydrolase
MPFVTVREAFISTARQYCKNDEVVGKCWQEIASCYSEPHRFYHTMHHLQYMMNVLSPLWDLIHDPEVLVFSVVYHDVVYDSKRGDNEERSADLALKRLQELIVPQTVSDEVYNFVLATKSHVGKSDDLEILLDADLAVLGADPLEYDEYAAAVRKEYRHVPGILYRMGRRGVLKKFLNRPEIYSTKELRDRFEVKARLNIDRELARL